MKSARRSKAGVENSEDDEEAFFAGEEIPLSDKDDDSSCDASVDDRRDAMADEYEESKKEGQASQNQANSLNSNHQNQNNQSASGA